VETQNKKAGFFGWTNVWLLFFIYMTSTGMVVYGYSVIFPAMIKATEWSRGSASIAHTLNVLLMGLLVPLAAYMLKKIGSRRTIILGNVIMLAGLLLLGTITSSLWQWTVLWGIVVPLALVLCGIFPIQYTVMFWFNVKRATVLGIVMTGAAVGGFIAQPFFTWVMQSSDSWRIGWLTAGIIVILALVCSFFTRSKPEDLGQHPDGLSPEEAAGAGGGVKAARTYRTSDLWTTREALKTKAVWFLVIVGIAHGMAIITVMAHGVLHFIDSGLTEMQAATVLSVIILGSGAARFPMGWVADRIEPRWIITASLALMMLCLAGIWKTPGMGALMAMGLIFGFGYGAILVMFPAIMGNYFGPDAFAGIIAVLGPSLVVFGAATPVAAGFIADTTGSYDLAFIALIIILIVGTAFSFFMAPPQKKRPPRI
jgi:MFS family permease